MTSTLSSLHFYNPLHSQQQPSQHTYKRRVQLKRSAYQINDPIVQQQKFKLQLDVYQKKKKSVRFPDQEEQLQKVRYFYKTHAPTSVQQDPPVMETSVDDYILTQPNWSAAKTKSQLFFDQHNVKIRLESVNLTEGDPSLMAKNQFLLEGRCRALNLSFHKLVTIRYTFDLWRTFQEVTGTFRESIPSTSNTWDRFEFSIPIEAKKTTSQTFYLALRYTVNGQEFWDNNNGLNYEIVISPDKEKMAQYQPSTETAEVEKMMKRLTMTEQEEAKVEERIHQQQQQQQQHTSNSFMNYQQKIKDTKVLGKRYDFTASLTAATRNSKSSFLSPPPSPPETPDDDDAMFNYYTPPPIYFAANNGQIISSVKNNTKKEEVTAPKLRKSMIPSPTEPIPISSSPSVKAAASLSSSPMAPISMEGCYQMSYSDFVNKYCFYNSHSSPIYSTLSSSPSAVYS
ncbi:putative phosphatase regulatory subunit-domain-containing protein [Mycotypha africana]|uniref:putative phosphatase regulatory subunit-domain-containing protein n=1 Tax=Mycotypha africana TaxID=64632 RepID=UPI002301ABDB|nr:putative phosphatase regulatory subunit-domain-containing protein [Mycotypha africana]KAI8984607.1 putative phosphatase regulatory subunit-domain-containing protein [Mycotypha africana]